MKNPCAWRIRPCPPQVGHALGLVPALAPEPEHELASHRGRNPHLYGLAEKRLLEGDLHVVAQIGAALATAAAARAHAENALEQIGECRAEIGAEAAGAAKPAVFEGGMAEAIIGRTLVRVLEDLVRLVDFLEAELAALVARIAVRMPLHRELAEGGL